MKIFCPLCERDAPRFLKSQGKIYYHCLYCDLIFLFPSFFLTPEEEKERYLLHENTRENTGYVKMLQDFLTTTIFPLVTERGRALDFGCGPEPVLGLLLEEAGFQVDLYDPFFYPQGVKNYPYLLITATEVLEHIQDAQGVFFALLDLLPVGGYLALMTHLHHGPREFPNWWYSKDPTHVTFYSWQTCCYLQEAFSWTILYGDGKRQLLLQKTP